MRTVKEIINLLSSLDPNDEIWCIWIDKNELIDIINDTEYTDKEGNPIELDERLINNSFLHDVTASLDNADYVWERFNEELRDETRSCYERLLEAKEEAKEDTDLWDKE